MQADETTSGKVDLFGDPIPARPPAKRNRAFCRASLLLVSAALALHLGAWRQFSRGMVRSARGSSELWQQREQAGPEGRSPTFGAKQRQELWEEVDRYVNRGDVLSEIGLGLAASSLVCVVLSFLRREPASRFWPVFLLVVYVMMQFVVV